MKLGKKTRSSNGTALADLGIARADLEAIEDTLATRAMNVGYFDTPDGDPVVGVTYRCDFRAEEEWGIGDLVKALTGAKERSFHMSAKAKHHVAFFSDVNGLILSTEPLPQQEYLWGEMVGQPSWGSGDYPSCRDYADHFISYMPYAQGLNEHVRAWMTVKELREVGAKFGLEKLPRKKNELYQAVASAARAAQVAKHPDTWPAWFYNGKQMIFRADEGVAARVLARVIKAARDGQLAVGSGTSNPFSRGLLFFDARDETEGLKQAIKANHDWHDAQMKKLEPAEAELKRLGYRWYFLGRPSEINTGDGQKKLRFWVNGLRFDSLSREPILADQEEQDWMRQARDVFGWFTIDELKDRDLRVARIRARAEERTSRKAA